MRLIAALTLGTALVLAGCFGGGEDEPTDTPTTSTPVTSTPPTGGTGTGTGTGGNGTGTGGNGTGTGGSGTTPPPAPKEACSGTGNFASASAPAATACTIPAGYTKVSMNVTWSATGAGVGNGIKVSLKDPDGTEVLSCTYANPTPPTTVSPECGVDPVNISKAGEWSITYAGTGTVTATAKVNVS